MWKALTAAIGRRTFDSEQRLEDPRQLYNWRNNMQKELGPTNYEYADKTSGESGPVWFSGGKKMNYWRYEEFSMRGSFGHASVVWKGHPGTPGIGFCLTNEAGGIRCYEPLASAWPNPIPDILDDTSDVRQMWSDETGKHFCWQRDYPVNLFT